MRVALDSGVIHNVMENAPEYGRPVSPEGMEREWNTVLPTVSVQGAKSSFIPLSDVAHRPVRAGWT